MSNVHQHFLFIHGPKWTSSSDFMDMDQVLRKWVSSYNGWERQRWYVTSVTEFPFSLRHCGCLSLFLLAGPIFTSKICTENNFNIFQVATSFYQPVMRQHAVSSQIAWKFFYCVMEPLKSVLVVFLLLRAFSRTLHRFIYIVKRFVRESRN